MSVGENLKTVLGKWSRALHIDRFVVNSGLEGVAWGILCKGKSEELRDFYKRNRERVERVYNLLEDDLSKEVYAGMIKYRCSRKIKDRPYYDEKNQYFVKDICLPDKDTVFVDCGAYVGDTYTVFSKMLDNRVKGYVALEPSSGNYAKLEKACHGDKAVTLVRCGAWNENGVLYISSLGSSSKVGMEKPEGDYEQINVVKLDDVEACRNATWIKMDIEGAEMNALAGADELIKRNVPVLTICIYHSDEEMISIPEYIMNLGLDYKYYVRHHWYRKDETVLYAIPR